MSNPNKNDVKAQEKASERVSIDDALKFLEDFKEWLLRNINKECFIEGDYAVKAIRAIERAISYINWARQTLRARSNQNSYSNYSNTRSFSYRKPYSKSFKKFYGGKRSWRKRY